MLRLILERVRRAAFPDAAAPAQEPAPAQDDAAPWGRFAATAAAAAFCGALAAFAILLFSDPYDSGRFARRESRPAPAGDSPRFAAVALGRDPAFFAAVIGNSHVQLIDPAALAKAGLGRWVSLATPGTGPREQLAMLDWFARAHKAGPSAVLIGVDSKWCSASAEPPLDHPFPFWLYARSNLDYAAGLFRLSSLTALRKRLAAQMKPQPRARDDGYLDYAATYAALDPDGAKGRAELARPLDAFAAAAPHSPYGPLERLAAALDALPAQTFVVLLRPPIAPSARPAPGASSDTARRACGEALATIVGRRPRTLTLDWIAGPGADDPANYYDREHYRAPLARGLENAVVAALREARHGAGEGAR
jgi:hypothetical protein